jgi:hypothetical protein
MERSRIYTSGMGILLSFSFDLATLPAGTVSSQVSHATLIVFVNRVNVAGSVSVAPVTASWGEYSVTSAAAQAAGSSIGNFPVSVAGQFVSVDVTNQVQAWLNTPASNNGFALTSAAADVLSTARKMTRLAMRRDSISRSSIKDLLAYRAYKAYRAYLELLVCRDRPGSLDPLVRKGFRASKAPPGQRELPGQRGLKALQSTSRAHGLMQLPTPLAMRCSTTARALSPWRTQISITSRVRAPRNGPCWRSKVPWEHRAQSERPACKGQLA